MVKGRLRDLGRLRVRLRKWEGDWDWESNTEWGSNIEWGRLRDSETVSIDREWNGEWDSTKLEFNELEYGDPAT